MGLRDAQIVLEKLTDALQVDKGARGGVVVDVPSTKESIATLLNTSARTCVPCVPRRTTTDESF